MLRWPFQCRLGAVDSHEEGAAWHHDAHRGAAPTSRDSGCRDRHRRRARRRVSPAPRSQTRTESASGESWRASWTFVRSGNRGWVSIAGPSLSRSSRESVSRTTTACGLPTSTGTTVTVSPARSSPSSAKTVTSPSACLIVPSVPTGSAGDPPATGLDLDLARPGLPQEPGGGNARAVPRHLRDGAVGIPDHHHCRGSVNADDLQHSVAPDPVEHVTQATHAVHRQVPGVGLLDEDVRVAEGVPLLEPHGCVRLPPCEPEQFVRDVGRGTRPVDHPDPRDPAHPLPLVCGDRRVRTTIRSSASVEGSSTISRRPSAFSAVRETPAARAARTSSTTPRANISSARCRMRSARTSAGTSRPAISVGRRVASLQSRSLPLTRERPTSASSSARTSRLVSVACTTVRALGSRRRNRSMPRPGLRRPPPGSAGVAPARPRRNLEVGDRGPEIEPRAAGDDRSARALDEHVDRLVCRRRVRTDAHLLGERSDPDELRRTRRLVREDRQTAVDLHRIGGDDLGSELLGEPLGDCALARRGRSVQRNNLHPRCERSSAALVVTARGVRFGHVGGGRLSGHRPPPHASSLTPKPRRVCHGFGAATRRSIHRGTGLMPGQGRAPDLAGLSTSRSRSRRGRGRLARRYP